MGEERVDTEGAICAHKQSPTPVTATQSANLGYRFMKRTFDIAFSSAVVVIGFVPGAILAVAVAKDTGGNPIYSQERVGKSGKPFKILKFRSMVADADDVEKHLNPVQLEQWLRERKVDDDPRITKLGHFLRKTSVDEFPQFINVFLGQMSVIGPRAITKDELHFFGSQQSVLLSIRPGITGLWQTGPRNDYTFESGKRQELELTYVREASLALDFKLFFKTFASMVGGTGR